MPSIDRLCHILSFLPTKFSVATSILAKRWRFAEFSDIMNRVMLLYKVQRLDTFRLSYTRMSVACINLRHELPMSLRAICKTLVDLRLHYCVGIPITDVVCLPSLKKLHLYSVQYDVDETLPHLLSGCPVLEELIIEGIVDEDLVCCYISSPTIKRLTVDFHAPALRYLQLQDCLSEHISARTLTSLIEADICFNNYKVEEDYFYIVINFFDSLCNVKFLKFSSGYNEFLDMPFADSSQSTIRFDNLTKLELAADWLFLTKFLEGADNLEVLIIREVDEDLKYWMEPEQVPTCLLSHLRSITIDQFGCTEHEFEMIRYLLTNSQVLKRMEIYSQHHRISLFQRGSEACELTWITTAIARHVQIIDLYLRYYQVMLPLCLFTCKTLVDLRLHGCVVNFKPFRTCFLAVKHAIEELIIEKVLDQHQDLGCCLISSTTIKRLTINCELDGYESYDPEYRVEINAPALRYLQLQDALSKHISAQTLTSLLEADICFNNENVEADYSYTISLLNFVDSLCNVKCLKLSCGYTEVCIRSSIISLCIFIYPSTSRLRR
ncbi:hypothetical protein Pfo_014134 [Paulownia fortunei]|nr:hypothetical protein Pfo_014134 [Paulownia fortunei]